MMSNYSKISTILYVEDEEGVRKGYEKALNRYAKELYVACDGEEGLSLYIQYQPDIVITDINMPKMNGIKMSKAIKKINPEQQIIITTAHSETGYFIEAIELQINSYLLKPVDKNMLKKKILEIAKVQKLNDEVNAKQALMEEIANLQNNMLVVYDESNIPIFANKPFLSFFNVKDIEEFSKKIHNLRDTFIKQDDVYSYDNTNDIHWTVELEQLDEDKRLVSINAHKIFENTCSIPQTFLVNIKKVAITNHKICTFSEITSITTKKKEFEIKAFIDELTQIPNRAKFNQVLNKEIERYHRYKQELSLIIFDIDYFKQFNDTYGHQLGDVILCELTQLVGNRVRTNDLFARWGGEEFIIILTNTDLSSARSFAENIRLSVKQHRFKNDLKLTCSFGVATINIEDNEESFIKRADEALYQAKQTGRNKVNYQ